jgi:pimeloyl-ACP methyl ester carboxylesterase
MPCCSLPPPLPVFEYAKQCLSIPTTHGKTYCELFTSKNSKFKSDQPLPEDAVVLLVIHGLGGGSNHFNVSEIPPLLAQNDCIVVTFDLYSHGRSQILDNKTTPHDVDLFLTQIYDLIHHKDLPFHQKQKINMLGFSFGGFLLLNYLIKYHKNPSQPCCATNHCIHKVTFQSPWNGYVPSALRGLIRIPGLLPLFKPADMNFINNYHALRHILLHADREKKFATCIGEFLELLKNHDEEHAHHPMTTEVTDRQHTASEILFISGASKIDGAFFTGIAMKLHKAVMKDYEKKTAGDPNNAIKNKKQKNKKNRDPSEIPEYEKRFHVKICPKADHMTFVHETHLDVGEYYRKAISDFMLPKFSLKINDDPLPPPAEEEEEEEAPSMSPIHSKRKTHSIDSIDEGIAVKDTIIDEKEAESVESSQHS